MPACSCIPSKQKFNFLCDAMFNDATRALLTKRIAPQTQQLLLSQICPQTLENRAVQHHL